MLCLESPTAGTIGFVVGRIVPGGAIEVIPDAEIYNVAVIESEQGNGYGQLLFDGFCEKCFEKEAQNIWLEVRASNKKAIDFYHRNGFEMVQSRNNFYENPREHALLMKLSLKKETA
jgi:ribosomal-protein-alanine N-acetyltransferase